MHRSGAAATRSRAAQLGCPGVDDDGLVAVLLLADALDVLEPYNSTKPQPRPTAVDPDPRRRQSPPAGASPAVPLCHCSLSPSG